MIVEVKVELKIPVMVQTIVHVIYNATYNANDNVTRTLRTMTNKNSGTRIAYLHGVYCLDNATIKIPLFTK